jgi:phosphoribosylformimino-5-aminoimidazole carboxamide ribotide isomerase
LNTIPVIDVLNGVVVHAVKGKRKEYRPIESILCNSTDPVELAKCFRTLGFKQLYLADLDAIMGKTPNFKLYRKIADASNLELIIDAGISDLNSAKSMLENRVKKVIVGTETLRSKSFIQKALDFLEKNRIMVSLDIKNGEVITSPEFDGCKEALCLLQDFRKMGVSEFIILDLNRVGSSEGVNMPFLKQAINVLSSGVYVGGGVRDISDLLELQTIEVSGVLVATSLHNGKVSIADLKKADLL